MVRAVIVSLILIGCAAVSVLAIAAWEWRGRTPAPILVKDGEGTSTAPLPTAPPLLVMQAQPDSSSGEPPPPPYLDYPVVYGTPWEGNNVQIADGVRVGFAKANRPDEPYDDAYYAWKGVTIDYQKIPENSGSFRGELPVNIAKLRVMEVDPPTFYLALSDGSFIPGYYRKTPRPSTFYHWKGVVLKDKEVPDFAREKYLLTEKAAKYTIDIEPPKHIIAQPELWKKE